MTSSHHPLTSPPIRNNSIEQATEAALAAAARPHVLVRQIGPDDMRGAQGIIADVWGVQQVPQSNLLQSLCRAGNPVLVAVRAGEVVGVTFGFLGWQDGLHLHSHMAAVGKGIESSGIGNALKLAQRAVCLAHGITEMRWTFDPMVARNAHFNLVKLGAEVRQFLPNLYGEMDDTINSGDHSDRFEVSWWLDAKSVEARSAASIRDSPEVERVPIPDDFLALRRSAPEKARTARRRVRARLVELFGQGLTPTWVSGGYAFRRAPLASVRGSDDVRHP